jgi:hypothetical protein
VGPKHTFPHLIHKGTFPDFSKKPGKVTAHSQKSSPKLPAFFENSSPQFPVFLKKERSRSRQLQKKIDPLAEYSQKRSGRGYPLILHQSVHHFLWNPGVKPVPADRRQRG